MLDIPRSRRILALGLPIMAGMASQSVLNLIDAAMVGSLGAEALAAVGIAGYANFMTIALVIGIGAGVQAMVARRHGEQKEHELALPLNAGLLLMLCMALPIVLIALPLARPLMHALLPDPAVSELASEYYLARLAGIFAVGCNFAFRGFWNGIGQSRVYMRTLIATHLLNIALSYCLIFGKFGFPALGSLGAGLGTSISLYFGSLLYFLQCWRIRHQVGFWQNRQLREQLPMLFKLAMPNSIQQLLFSGGLVTLFFIIGHIGTDELAVAHVLLTLVLFLILPAVGLGMSATSLVSQALGRQDADDAWRWGWDICKLAVLLLMTMALPMWLLPRHILALFLHQADLIELAVLPLTITGVAICLDGIAIVLTNSLLGAGASRQVMLVTLSVQWLLFLPAAWLIGPVLGFGLLAVWLLQAGQRLLTTLIFVTLWQRRHWQHIRI